MTDTSEFVLRAIKAFLIPGLLGALYYCVVTLGARRVSTTPLYRYFARVGMVLLAATLWWLVFASWYSRAVLPSGTLNFNHPPEELGAAYGLHTIWIWCAAALASWPKRTFHDSQTA
jgi:hypothetical protein